MTKKENDMHKEITLADQILNFNNELSNKTLALPKGYKVINPFASVQKDRVRAVTRAFYKKYYNDMQTRRLIVGSSPARRGTAVTGIPFGDALHLQEETGINIDGFYVNRSSSNFLYDVMNEYGGCKKFYSHFYMNFVCPLGIVKINEKGNEVNCNYYENKVLKNSLHSFIVSSLIKQIKFGLDTSVCYCIGSGENYNFLSKINAEYALFNTIVPLEHPRFIMQYNAKRKEVFLNKYINALCGR